VPDSTEEPGSAGPPAAPKTAPGNPPDPPSTGDADPTPVRLSRRRFLAQALAFIGLGALAGGAVAELVSLSGAPGESAPSGPAPGSVPAGLVPTPPGASPEPIQSAPPPGPGRAARENLRRGTDAWELPLRGTGDAEAYVGAVSVAEGDRLAFHVASALPRADITLYRLGWYAGRGARVIARWRNLAIVARGDSTTDPVTGLVRCRWPEAVTVPVPQGWVSGLYLAVVSPVGGEPQYCHFVVRESRATAPILFVSSATTHQAYNAWGGKSLYPDASTGAPTITGESNAVTASWDRPYADQRGAGLVLRWEYPFVRWLEAGGYDVAYATDMDLERFPEIATGRRLLLFVGHPEYWSAPARKTLEAAIAAGTNVAFFSANEIYWRVRYDPLAGGQYRTVTCYRKANIDPLADVDPSVATTQWRALPDQHPESLVIGQMYGHIVIAPGNYVCSNANHWIYAGSGMARGDSILNLIGPEYDRVWPALAPPGLEILAISPVTPNFGHDRGVEDASLPNEPNPPVHNATIYTAPSGATVFSAGTIQWSWALDDWGSPESAGVRTPLDARVGRITANILGRLG
jgi:hypothetical protein